MIESPSARASGSPEASGAAPPAPGSLIHDVLRAHGGVERWKRVARIDCTLRCGGLAFELRGKSTGLLRRRVSVYPHRRLTVFHDLPGPGQHARWEGDSVCLDRGPSRPALLREEARAHFFEPSARRRWDDLDLTYFAGYAAWNYLSFPFLLAEPGVRVTSHRLLGQDWLPADFPAALTTHSSRQHFRIDSDGTLLRHDYTAEVFGAWAHAANLCLDSRWISGLRLYTRRRVVPSLGRLARLPGPVLVWLELDDLSVLDRD